MVVQLKAKQIVRFRDEELKKIFDAVDGPIKDQWKFLLLTGFRAGESCALEWDHVDFIEKVIRVFNVKENTWDYFPMDKTLEDFMNDLPRAYEPYVFSQRKVWWLSRKMSLTIQRLKLRKGLGLHTLRMNFIARLVNSGLTESEVMHLARHRSLSTTRKHYTPFDQRKMRKALARSRKSTHDPIPLRKQEELHTSSQELKELF